MVSVSAGSLDLRKNARKAKKRGHDDVALAVTWVPLFFRLIDEERHRDGCHARVSLRGLKRIMRFVDLFFSAREN